PVRPGCRQFHPLDQFLNDRPDRPVVRDRHIRPLIPGLVNNGHCDFTHRKPSFFLWHLSLFPLYNNTLTEAVRVGENRWMKKKFSRRPVFQKGGIPRAGISGLRSQENGRKTPYKSEY